MQYLKGTIKINTTNIIANIMLIPPTEYRLGEWSGEGVSCNYIEPGQYNTNVGIIILNNISLRNGTDFLVEFVGSGKFLGFN